MSEVIMQEHPGSKKLFYNLRERYYCSNLSEKDQTFSYNCQVCIKSKPNAKQQLRPPLKNINDPSNGPENVLEFNLKGLLPPSCGFTNILTAVDVISRYMFSIPLRRPDAPSVVKVLMSIFTRHAFVEYHPDGQKHSLHCWNHATNDGTSRKKTCNRNTCTYHRHDRT